MHGGEQLGLRALAAVAGLFHELAEGGRGRVFTGIDDAARRLQRDVVDAVPVLLHEHDLVLVGEGDHHGPVAEADRDHDTRSIDSGVVQDVVLQELDERVAGDGSRGAADRARQSRALAWETALAALGYIRDETHMKKLAAAAVALALFAPVLLAPREALAQADAQKAALAQSLFDEADKAMKAKNFGEACPKLERVVSLIPDGLGAKLTLAECYEGAGKLASAFGTYLAAEGAARRTGQTERADLAKAKLDALKPKLATITVEVPDDVRKAPGFALKRDGAEVLDAEYGVAVAVDKGEHTIVATADGHPPWEQKITIDDAQKQSVKVELGAGSTAGGGDTGTGGKVGGSGEPPPADKPEGTFMTPVRIAGLGIGIGGVVVGAIGIGLGVHAKGLYDDSNETGGCNADTQQCTTQAGVDQRDSAVTFANASTGLVIAGGVLAVGGIIMFAVAPSGDAGEVGPAKAARLTLGISPGFLSLNGAF